MGMMPMGMGGMMPGMGMPGAAGGGAAGAPVAEEKKPEKTSFDVKLEKFEAASKIKIIKEVRAFTALGLKEAKELVEKAPTLLKQGVGKEEAEQIIEKLKAIGGTAIMEWNLLLPHWKLLPHWSVSLPACESFPFFQIHSQWESNCNAIAPEFYHHLTQLTTSENISCCLIWELINQHLIS